MGHAISEPKYLFYYYKSYSININSYSFSESLQSISFFYTVNQLIICYRILFCGERFVEISCVEIFK